MAPRKATRFQFVNVEGMLLDFAIENLASGTEFSTI